MPYFYEAYIVPGSILVPTLVLLFKRKILPYPLKILSLYLLASCLINAVAVILAVNNRPNLWLLHIYTIVESVLLLFFFRAVISSPKVRRIIGVLLALFPMVCVIDLLLFEPASRFNSYPRSAEALLFVFLAVSYWMVGSGHDRYGSWAANPYNWVVSGVLLYFASSFSLFLFSDAMLSDRKIKPTPALTQIISIVWSVHGTLVIIQYLLFAIGISKCKK